MVRIYSDIMRIIIVLFALIVLSLFCSITYGQTAIWQGSPTQFTGQFGGTGANKWLLLPNDTVNFTNTSLRDNFLLAGKSGFLYWYDSVSGYWQRLANASALGLSTLTLGNGLTGGSYNGSASVTATVDTAIIATQYDLTQIPSYWDTTIDNGSGNPTYGLYSNRYIRIGGGRARPATIPWNDSTSLELFRHGPNLNSFRMAYAGSTTAANNFSFFRCEGTLNSPTATTSGKHIFAMSPHASNGAGGWPLLGTLTWQTAENIDASNLGTTIFLRNFDTLGGALLDRWRVQGDGSLALVPQGNQVRVGGYISLGSTYEFQVNGEEVTTGIDEYATDISGSYTARTKIDKGYADATYAPISGSANYEAPLTFSTGLTRTTNTITNNLSTGVSGGQSVIGGTAGGNNLTLSSTTNGTKGKLIFGTSAYDEVNNRLGIGTASPSYNIDVNTTADADIRLKTANNAYNRIDRGATNKDGGFMFLTNGSANWMIGVFGASVATGTDVDFYDFSGTPGTRMKISQTTGTLNTRNIEPLTDDTYYLGENSATTPHAWKGAIFKDQGNGNYYRLEIINGVITATAL